MTRSSTTDGDAKKTDVETGTSHCSVHCPSHFLFSSGAVADGSDIETLSDEEEDDEHASASTLKGAAYLAVGGGLIFVCSSPFIEAVVEASVLLKVSPTLLAFFLAPVASEMPEILEAISLARRGHVPGMVLA